MSESKRIDAAPRRWWSGYLPLAIALLAEVIFFDLYGYQERGMHFAAPGNLLMVLNQAAIYGVIGVGMTFVILTGGIDLAVGSMLALAGVLCAKTVLAIDASPAASIGVGYLAALAAGAATGATAGFFITRFRVPPFIATLSLMSLLRGLANMLTDGRPISNLPLAYSALGRQHWFFGIPNAVVLFAAVFGIGAVLLGYTKFGRHVRAIGGNEESARLSGVPIARVKTLVYALSGAMAALGGLLLSSRLGSGAPAVGIGDELTVIAAVVVGGTSLSGGRGGLGNTLLGLLIVSTLSSGLNWINVQTFGQQVVLGLVILAAVLLDRVRSPH